MPLINNSSIAPHKHVCFIRDLLATSGAGIQPQNCASHCWEVLNRELVAERESFPKAEVRFFGLDRLRQVPFFLASMMQSLSVAKDKTLSARGCLLGLLRFRVQG